MMIQIQNPFLTAQSTQIKSVISVAIKDFIHHYPRALFNDIPRVGAHFYDIPGSGRTFTTYPGRDCSMMRLISFLLLGMCDCVMSIVSLGLSVRLSWYPMWMQWLR